MGKLPEPEKLSKVNYSTPDVDWLDLKTTFEPGSYCYGEKPKGVEILGLPNPREWNPADADWKLAPNWKETMKSGMKTRLERFRSLQLFMDICVRCGACSDKCHFYLGTGDVKNMPVLRAELMRSVYRKEHTIGGKLLGKLASAREMDEEVLKEWYKYFYQCTECRRCSVFCPYGIDTAEITMHARELMHEVGVGINWVVEPASNSFRTGNHLGLTPHAITNSVEMLVEDIKDITGIDVNPTFNRKGAEVLFITPSADFFAEPGIFTMMGYMLLFEHIGLDYTLSTYASEGGNFGLFTSHEMMKRLNSKMYAEAERLGVKWILGGECGHMWRVVHQYMDTLTGPANFLETPVSPITGTKFDYAKQTKFVHIAEFTADLIRNNKLNLDKSRNNHRKVTFHDSCNVARGMGMFEEPRYILNNTVNEFYEMSDETIREKTFCCGSGSGLNTNEYMETRLKGGFPRANAVKHVQEEHGVNLLTAICAIDRAAFPPLLDYWTPGVDTSGLHELIGNALIMEGEITRDVDLRQEPLAAPQNTGVENVQQD
ncbi:MAG: sulfate reduction electron transfer complex DsrMKJOP subunit DsrK [Leptospirales bacterium]